MSCPYSHSSPEQPRPASFLPVSDEVANYPQKIKDSRVDWAVVVAENQEPSSVFEQLKTGVECLAMQQDVIACSGIAVASNMPMHNSCAPVLDSSNTNKPRHF